MIFGLLQRAGRKRVREADEEMYEDLSNMLELLAELMASQYEGLGGCFCHCALCWDM